MSHLKCTDKDTIKIDDNDGKLHLYVCAALNGDRWAAQLTFDKNKRTVTDLKEQGYALVSATARSLVKAKIISE